MAVPSESEPVESASAATMLDLGGGETQAAMGGGGGAGCLGENKKYTATRFAYAGNGETVTHVMGEQWCWNGSAECGQPGGPSNYKVLWAREFRYDGARARYMNAKLNTADLTLNNAGTVWTDYDGDGAYADYTITGSDPNYTFTETDKHEPGQWRGSGGFSNYLHNDMLGTLRQTTDSSGTALDADVYTAFGERVSGTVDRHGFVGAQGYQSTIEGGTEVFSYRHLGARYYDPAAGRFLQRDPSGIAGGVNVYAYVFNMPTRGIDPTGNGFLDGNNAFHQWVGNWVWGTIHSQETLANMSDGRAIAEAVGVSVAVGVVGTVGYVAATAEGTVSLVVGSGRAGVHVAVSSSTAGIWHYMNPAVTGPTQIVGAWGTRILTLPARYPDAIRNMSESAMNCATGALKGLIDAF